MWNAHKRTRRWDVDLESGILKWPIWFVAGSWVPCSLLQRAAHYNLQPLRCACCSSNHNERQPISFERNRRAPVLLHPSELDSMVDSSSSSPNAPVGGVKGFFMKAGKSFYSAGLFAKDASWWLAQKGGTWGLMIASTSMVVLLPLFFEINREAQVWDWVLIFQISGLCSCMRTYGTFANQE